MKSINDYVQEAHQNAVDKGWWQEERSFGEIIALIHSEASEALEDYRNGKRPNEEWYEAKPKMLPDYSAIIPRDDWADKEGFEVRPEWKPCGIPSELADIVIRVFDAAGKYGIDLQRAIDEKMAYNATRPQRHGGKKN